MLRGLETAMVSLDLQHIPPELRPLQVTIWRVQLVPVSLYHRLRFFRRLKSRRERLGEQHAEEREEGGRYEAEHGL